VIPVLKHGYVNDFLSKKGFPITIAAPGKVLSLAKKLVGKRVDTRDLLSRLESPVDTISQLVKTFQIG
jgi:hypothetical protein